MNAYVLADRGTWLSFRNRGDLVVLVEGDRRLFNQYGVMLVNPAKHPHVKQRRSGSSSSTGSCRRKARRRSPATGSAASSCSSRTRQDELWDPAGAVPILRFDRRRTSLAAAGTLLLI